MKTSWPPLRWALTTSLCFWLLLSHVYVQFVPVRKKLVRGSRAGQQELSIELKGVESLVDPKLVIVCVVGNDGERRVDLTVSVGDAVLRRVGISPKTTTRIDIAWPRPDGISSGDRVTLAAAGGAWTLDYLELANLHGFTRGAVDLLILPEGQPFGRAPAWWILAFVGCALLASRAGPARWPRWLRVLWIPLAAIVAACFLMITLSPLVSSFNVVLSPGTFALGTLVLAAPRIWALGREAWSRSDPVRRALAAVPWWPVVTTVAIGAYALFLASHVGAYAGGSDSSGYMNNARLIRDLSIRTPRRIIAGVPAADLSVFAYVPLGFRPRGDLDMVPTYPMGLPLLVLATEKVTGQGLAPHATMVWHTLLGVGLVYWLGRLASLSRGLAALGALLLATSQQYVFSSLTLMSDTPAMVWTTTAVLLAWRSRRAARWAALAGAALSIAVLVRPTNILALFPMAVCLGLSVQRWAWLVAGGLPGAALLLGYNLSAYGHASETGYGDVSTAFSSANVPASLRNYVAWLPVSLTPIVVLALGLPFLWKRSPRIITMLVLWILSFCGVYAFYYHTHETWWYLRFLLPAFPPLVVGALLVGRALAALWPGRPTAARARLRAVAAQFLLAAAVLAHNLAWDGRLLASQIGRSEHVYVEVADWARANLPRQSAVAAMQMSGALFYYTDFPLLRWDNISRSGFSMLIAALEGRQQPLYAVLAEWELDEYRVLTDHLPGEWRLVGTVRDVKIWRFDGPQSPASP